MFALSLKGLNWATEPYSEWIIAHGTMELWDIATEEDQVPMWGEALAIAYRISCDSQSLRLGL